MDKAKVLKTVTVETVRSIELEEDDLKAIIRAWAYDSHGFAAPNTEVHFETGCDFVSGVTVVCKTTVETDSKA